MYVKEEDLAFAFGVHLYNQISGVHCLEYRFHKKQRVRNCGASKNEEGEVNWPSSDESFFPTEEWPSQWL